MALTKTSNPVDRLESILQDQDRLIVRRFMAALKIFCESDTEYHKYDSSKIDLLKSNCGVTHVAVYGWLKKHAEGKLFTIRGIFDVCLGFARVTEKPIETLIELLEGDISPEQYFDSPSVVKPQEDKGVEEIYADIQKLSLESKVLLLKKIADGVQWEISGYNSSVVKEKGMEEFRNAILSDFLGVKPGTFLSQTQRMQAVEAFMNRFEKPLDANVKSIYGAIRLLLEAAIAEPPQTEVLQSPEVPSVLAVIVAYHPAFESKPENYLNSLVEAQSRIRTNNNR